MTCVTLSPAASRLKRMLEDMPLPDERVAEAEALIKQCSDVELASLGLGPPPRPVVPRGLHDGSGGAGVSGGASGGSGGGKAPAMGPQQRLTAVQHVINSLQYNHAPGYHYNVSKSRPFSRIMDTAREALRAALPIKCLEAVFLGTLLTAGWHELDRLPLAFKSSVQGNTYRHIVLAVFHGPSRKWGALGLSRRSELMDKDLAYDSLADLVSDYKAAYERWWHTLVRVYVGLPLDHDTYYSGPVCWRYLTLSLTGRRSWTAHRTALDSFAAQSRRLAGKFRSLGSKPSLDASLGGVAEQQQEAQQQQHTRQIGGAGAAGDKGGPVAPAGGAARCARSVSPSRRRRPPPPPPCMAPPVPRCPITPTRVHPASSHAAAPCSPATVSGTSAHAVSSAQPCKSGASLPGLATETSRGSADKAATAGVHASNGPGDHSSSSDIRLPGEGVEGSAVAAAAIGASMRAAHRFDAVAAGGGGQSSGRGQSRAQGSADKQLEAARLQQGSGMRGGSRGGRATGGRPRRSSDPGGAAALAAAAAAPRRSRVNPSGKVQARMLKQQMQAEELRGSRVGLPGSPGRNGASCAVVGEGAACAEGQEGDREQAEEEEDVEESESDEEEYLSEGSDSDAAGS